MALKIHLNMMLLFDVCFLVCGHSDGMPGSVLGGVSAERDNKGSYFQLENILNTCCLIFHQPLIQLINK